MKPFDLAKQTIDFNKATFDNSFSMMVMIQEQMEKTVSLFLDQAAWLPDEGKKLVTEWVSSYKKGCAEFKNTVDESYKKVDSYFTSQKDAK